MQNFSILKQANKVILPLFVLASPVAAAGFWELAGMAATVIGAGSNIVQTGRNMYKNYRTPSTADPAINDAHIHINMLRSADLEETCHARWKEHDKRIEDLESANNKALKKDLDEANERAQFWQDLDEHGQLVIDQTTDFIDVYKLVNEFWGRQRRTYERNRGNWTAAVVEDTLKKLTQYSEHCDKLKNVIGAQIQVTFPYEGKGGVMSAAERYARHTERETRRAELWGRRDRFHREELAAGKFHSVSVSAPEDIIYNLFLEAFKQTQSVIGHGVVSFNLDDHEFVPYKETIETKIAGISVKESPKDDRFGRRRTTTSASHTKLPAASSPIAIRRKATADTSLSSQSWTGSSASFGSPTASSITDYTDESDSDRGRPLRSRKSKNVSEDEGSDSEPSEDDVKPKTSSSMTNSRRLPARPLAKPVARTAAKSIAKPPAREDVDLGSDSDSGSDSRSSDVDSD
jgi:hypothetical protein